MKALVTRLLRRPITRPSKARIIGGLVGVVGYILSPLSWWNDAFVNIPIATAIGLALEKLAHIEFIVGFVAGYWLTNVIGIILMIAGGSAAVRGGIKRRDIIISLLGATAYTIAATIIYSIVKGGSPWSH